MIEHPRERLMAYADGELDAAAAAAVEEHIDLCTECGRELAVVRELKGAMRNMDSSQTGDLWSGIHRKLTTPVGWLLILAGIIFWVALAVVRWFQSELTIEWLATTAMITGFVLVLIAIGHEQYRAWKIERYKDVER